MSFFRDKWVWITGASAGIGKALAIAFSEQGAHLILSSRKYEDLVAVGKLCVGSGEVKIITLDLADEKSLISAFQETQEFTEKIDILVNNGGISQRALALETEDEVTRKIMEVNFFGSTTLTKLVLPAMLEHGSGQFLVTSSVAGKFGTPLRTTYCASKHALEGYFEGLRFEYEGQGIGVTVMAPGYIKTDVSINALTGDGDKTNILDDIQANGMEPSRLATQALKALERNKADVYIGGKEILAIYLKRYAPWLFRKVIRNEFRDKM